MEAAEKKEHDSLWTYKRVSEDRGVWVVENENKAWVPGASTATSSSAKKQAVTIDLTEAKADRAQGKKRPRSAASAASVAIKAAPWRAKKAKGEDLKEEAKPKATEEEAKPKAEAKAEAKAEGECATPQPKFFANRSHGRLLAPTAKYGGPVVLPWATQEWNPPPYQRSEKWDLDCLDP